jgi:hypothetical protein
LVGCSEVRKNIGVVSLQRGRVSFSLGDESSADAARRANGCGWGGPEATR